MRSYEESGQLHEAIQVRRRMEWQCPIKELEAALTADGPTGYWRTIVEELQRRCSQHPVHPVTIAVAYTHLGDRKSALLWLDQAVEERDPWAVYINVDPWFAALRGNSRFQEIVRKAGIP